MKERPNISEALLRLIGNSAWEVKRTHGSMFFLEIGTPISRSGQTRAHGEWHFLFECCHWRFETDDIIVVGSEDDQAFIDQTFANLSLGVVKKAEVSRPSHDLRIEFSTGVRFLTFSTSSEATDQWTQWLLYGAGEYAWISNGGGHVKCIVGNEPVRDSFPRDQAIDSL
jgi:hypothetical protein